MSSLDLRSSRLKKGLSQVDAARRLGVSQAYVAMLESGRRRLPSKLAGRVMKVYDVPPTVVPLSGGGRSGGVGEHHGADELARDLAALGYPGFAYMKPRRWSPRNPAEVLLTALGNDDLDSRLVEALPWLLLQYPSAGRDWLVREAKVRDVQNRLGFVATLARRVAERAGNEGTALALRDLERELERSLLAREDTLCRKSLPAPERRWLEQNRSDDARRWNVLSDWTPDALRYTRTSTTLA